MKNSFSKIILHTYSLTFTIILLNLVLLLFPLTGEFGYEFAIVNAIILFWIGGLFYYKRNYLVVNGPGISSIILFLVIPLLINIPFTLLVKGCPVCQSIPHYIVITVPAFFFGMFIMNLLFFFVPKFRLTLFLFIFIILVIIPVVEIYIYPQIYFYHFVIGFFPGTIYDEFIPVDSKLILYRFMNILFIAISLMLVSYSSFFKKKIYIIAITFLIITVWFGLLKNNFGFVTTESDIQNKLTGKIETENFIIFHDPGFKADKRAIEAAHEFYFRELTDELNIDFKEKITSFIFKDRDQKKELFGSRNADVAKPWLKQIYLDESNFDNTLKHELVHVLAGKFGVTPFKVAHNINPALIEGLAVAYENNFGDRSIHYFAKTGIESGYSISLEKLFGGLGFFGSTSSLSYLYAGSFIKYLSQHYTPDNIKQLYREGDFKKISGASIKELEKGYFDFIGTLDYTINEHTAQLYFGTPPLIEKKCPRYAAILSAEAWSEYENKNYAVAQEKFFELYEYTNNYNALNGLIQSDVKLKNFGQALNLANKNIDRFNESAYLYRLELQLADLNCLVSDSLASLNYINKVLDQYPNQDYYIAAEFRNMLIDNGLKVYSEYLLGKDEERYAILKKLAANGDSRFLVSRIITTADRLNKDLQQIEKDIGNAIPDSTFHSVFAAYQYSRYLYYRGNFDTALNFAKFGVENNGLIEYQETFDENYELIEWSINYCKYESKEKN